MKINPPNYEMINYADNMIKFYYSSYRPKTSTNIIENIAGRWLLNYSNSDKIGTVIFVPNQLVGGYSVSVDVFEGGVLQYKYAGNVIIPDDKTVKVDWQGMGCFTPGRCGQFFGTDLFKRKNNKEFSGQQSVSGLKTQAIRMVKK